MPPRSPPRSPARVSVGEPSFSRVDAEPKRQSSVNEFAAGGGLLGQKALEKVQQNQQRQQGSDRIKVGRKRGGQPTRLKPPERPHSVAGGERTDQLESVLPNMPPKVTRVAKRSARGAGGGGGSSDRGRPPALSRVQPRDLSPLRDPRGAASLAGSAATAIAQANPWTEGGSHPYSDQVREQAQREVTESRYTPGASVLPEEFRVSEVDPIFPSEMADNHDISFDETKGGFNTTVFPSKRPVRRSEVGKLRETLEKMLQRMEDEEAQKARKRELAAVEQDALVSMLGDSEADIQAKAQRQVRRDTDAKLAVVGRLQAEESVLLIVFDELSRQIAVQSKDRAGLMLQLVEQTSALFRGAVSVATNDAKLFESQNRRLAELNERLLKQQRELAAANDTIAARDARIEDLETTSREKDIDLEKLKAELKRVKMQRDEALKQVAHMRELERTKADLEREARESALMVRNLRAEIEDAKLETKQAKMQHKTEANVSADLYNQIQKLKKEMAMKDALHAANMAASHPASKDSGPVAPAEPVPVVKYDVPPQNENERKVQEAMKAKAAKELAEMEASVAAQAAKVAKRMGEDGLVTDEHLEDGAATAAQLMLSGHIEDKAISLDASGDEHKFSDVEAAGSEESSVAERMARLQLKRLARLVEDIDKQHKRAGFRLKEIADKQKRGEIVDDSEKVHLDVTQERFTDDMNAARNETKEIEKALRSKTDMGEMLLGTFLPARVARIKQRMEAALVEAKEIEEQEIASLKNTMEFGQMGAEEETNIAKRLAEAEHRHGGLLQYNEMLQDRLDVTNAEIKEIELALMEDFGVMDDKENKAIRQDTTSAPYLKMHRSAFEAADEPDDSEVLITSEAHVITLDQHIIELSDTVKTVLKQTGTTKGDLTQLVLDQVAELRRLTKPAPAPSPEKFAEMQSSREQASAAATTKPSTGASGVPVAQPATAAGKSGMAAIDETELDELRAALKAKTSEVKKLNTELKEAANNEELQHAQAELEATEKKLVRYKELLMAAEQESLLAQERLMKLMRENTNMAKQIEDAQAAIRSSQEELRLLRIELSKLQGEYEGTLKELAEVKAERDELLLDAKYKQMYLDLDEKHTALEKLAAEQADEIARLTGEVADARKKLQAALEELAAPMAAMVETAVQAEETAEDVADWLLNMMISTSHDVGETAMHWRAKLEEEEERRRQVEKERDDIAEKAANALAEIEDLKAKVNKLSFQLKESMDENSQLTKQVAKLTQDLAEVTRERDELLKRLQDLEAEVASLSMELKDEKARGKAVVEKLAMLEIVHAGLEEKYRAANLRIEELEALLKAAEAELKKHGIVGKWKEAALASQLAAMRDLLNKAKAEAETQTDDEPEPEPVPFVSVAPEVSLHAFPNIPVEVVVRVANRGDGPLMLEEVRLDDDAPWLQTDWSDAIAIEQWRGASTPRSGTDETSEGSDEPSFHEIKLRCTSETVGVQSGRLILSCNDPKQPEVLIPVTFTVLETPKPAEVIEVERPTSRPSSRDASMQERPSSRDGGAQTDPMANDMADELARLRALLAQLQAEMDALRAENASLKQQLKDALDELAATQAKLKELEDSILKGGGEGGDDDVFERLEWERKLRESLKHMVKETASHGCQTDSDEHKVSAHEQRDLMHDVHAGRQLHKPRFLAPLVDDETLAARSVKPLRWLLKLIYSVYDSKFTADAVDNRYGHPHDPFPEFIYMWTCKRYGLRDLVGATRWDLANAVDEYTEHLAEVRLFGSFMFEEYGTEQLGFFLYCRSVVHDHAAAGLPKTSAGGMEALLRAVGRYLPLQLTLDVIAQVLGHRLPTHAMELLVQNVRREGVLFSPETADFSTAGSSELLDASAMAAFYEKYGFRRTGGSVDEPIEEQLLVIEEARFLELLLQAYSTEREAYRVTLATVFSEADGDGDGEIDKNDFVNLAKNAVPGWTTGQAKDVFWRATAPLGIEVLTFDQVMSLADGYAFFNAHLALPRFTSEEEVLSASEVEMMWANM
jgi:chromosome segregation ATPase